MKVLKKQTNSKMCLICGMENEAGLKAPFYEMEDHTVVSIFEFHDFHQSYPGRTHGGMISCMLDEIIGRAIWIDEPTVWGVTMDLKVKFRKPILLETPVKAVGKIIKSSNRAFSGVGYIYDMEGTLLAEGEALYYKVPIEKAVIENGHESEVNVFVPDDVKEIN